MSAELAMAIPIMAWGAIKGLFSDTVLGDDNESHAARNSITIQKQRLELALEQKEVLLEAYATLDNPSDKLNKLHSTLAESTLGYSSVQHHMHKFLDEAKQNPEYIKSLVGSPKIHSIDFTSEDYKLEEAFDFVMNFAADLGQDKKEEKTI